MVIIISIATKECEWNVGININLRIVSEARFFPVHCGYRNEENK